jgi:hypothetical protein
MGPGPWAKPTRLHPMGGAQRAPNGLGSMGRAQGARPDGADPMGQTLWAHGPGLGPRPSAMGRNFFKNMFLNLVDYMLGTH